MKQMAEAKSTRRAEKGGMHPHGKLHHMELHEGKEGGMMVIHHFHPLSHGMTGGSEMNYAASPGQESKPPMPPEHHIFGPDDGEAMHAHIDEHFPMMAKGAPKLEEGEPASQSAEETGDEEV